jgi:hypothetical protein
MVPSSTSEELVLRYKGEGHRWVVAHEDSVAMSCDVMSPCLVISHVTS